MSTFQAIFLTIGSIIFLVVILGWPYLIYKAVEADMKQFYKTKPFLHGVYWHEQPSLPTGCRWPSCRCIPQKVNGKEKGLCNQRRES